MCGIFGYIGPHQAAPLLLEGLRRLEYRGYDSTGIAVKNGTINVHKKVGKVQDLRTVLPSSIPGTMGIAHTRWATHGGVTDENAHPHESCGRKGRDCPQRDHRECSNVENIPLRAGCSLVK